MQEGPLQRYRQMVEAGELAPDIAQELAAEKLQLLANRLAQYCEPRVGLMMKCRLIENYLFSIFL